MKQAIGIATLVETSSSTLEALREVAPFLAAVELRADRLGTLEVPALAGAFRGKLLGTYRSRLEGGEGANAPEKRAPILLQAAGRCDWIDLEGARDAVPELLRAIPPERRILSWHGSTSDVSDLLERWRALARVPARWYKLVVEARRPSETSLPLELLGALEPEERARTAAFALGEGGAWTRLCALHLGAPVVYGHVGSEPAAAGQLPWKRLLADYGLPELPEVEALFGVVGQPVLHSLSPRLHNAAYRALGIPALFVPFSVPSFSDFWLDLVESGLLDRLGMPLRGLAVTTPFKEVAVAVAGAVSPLADTLEAANSLVLREGVWEADSTDPDGVLGALRAQSVSVAGRPALVLGVGGAGRAAAFGLARAGAEVTVTNRDSDRGRAIASRLRVAYERLEELDLGRFSLIVQATPLGREERDPEPVPVEELGADCVLVDLVYGEQPTRWLRRARERGLRIVDGREVLLQQAVGQFFRMTGRELPLEVGRKVLGLEGGAR